MSKISTVENNIYFRKGRKKAMFKNFEVFEDRQEMS